MNRINRSNTSMTPLLTKDRVRTARVARCAALVTLWFTAVLSAQLPAPAGTTESRPWLGQEQRIEEHLRSAAIASIEDIGTGVTRPRRAYLAPSEPVESVAWKVLPPGRRGGFWESYKSEIAAYELDRLLNMHMVPPTVERRIGDETGAAVMWVTGMKSVKQLGGKVPSGPEWGKPIRQMLMFDNLIRNIDRNAGNILIGRPGDLILIDHSRAFTTDKKLQNKVERVDAELWERMQTLTRENLARALGRWLDEDAIAAIIERRDAMAATIDKLVAKNGRALVLIR
jgi:Phosphatidylinositol 3- and 4-kinase